MATAVLPNDDFDTNTDDQHLELFCLIWLDANANVKETRNTEQKLRSIINHLKKFQDIKQCQQYIKKRSQKDRLVLIVTGQMGQEIVPSIHELRQVMSIYVFCMNKKYHEEWACKFRKVKGVFVELDELISRIQADHKIQKKIEEPLSINIFTTETGAGKATIGINGQFIFSQVLIDCLLRLKSTEADENELVVCCKKEYKGNSVEFSNLREFEEDYSPNKVLWWYTRESFFYKTLNAALRTQNIHMIFLFRTFISDIYHQLQKYQAKKLLQVYRCQMISGDELTTLKQCIGQFISVNSFFSTSADRWKALSFLDVPNASKDSERILFEIEANPKKITTKPFADISEISDHPDELEVLFMLGSIFRLQSVDRNDDDEVWIIRMTLCSDDEHDLKQVLTHMKQQNGSGDTSLRTLGTILWNMGKLDLAEKYLSRLLKELPPNDPSLSSLYEDLGKLASQRGDYDMSVQWHEKSLALKNQYHPTTSSDIDKTTKPVAQLFPPSHVNNNTKMVQTGITVAGGNGSGNGLNQLCRPLNIYVDDDDQSIYIADCDNNRIVQWKYEAKNGQVVAGGNGKGKRMNQLTQPTNVIFDKKNDSLIISDQGNHRIVRWPRRNGTNGEIIISNITCDGLAIDNNGDFYVSDYGKHEVRRWRIGDTNGTIVAGGNEQGNHLNQLDGPGYIFVDHDYSVYVSDVGNDRVMKWLKGAKEGIVVAGGHGRGENLSQLSRPQGVTVDQWSNVYVIDQGNNRIMRWSKGVREGCIVVGKTGCGGQLHLSGSSAGLSSDRQGNIYVADVYEHRIQKFNFNSN